VSQPDDGTYRGDPPSAAAAYGTPPGYGPPPRYGPPGWAPMGRRPPTNAAAILALALCFAFPPAGLVTGLIARRQVQQTGEAGEGLALAAVIVGGISTTLFLLGLVIWLVAVASISSGSFGR
jgi:uncharacterized protein DUF4190